jgi:hypothetical protein
MAGDQRYCLECGRRRGDARIDYRPMLAAAPAGAAAVRAGTATTTTTTTTGGSAPRPSWSLPATLATIACLLLAVAIGVMIGRSGDGGSRSAATPAPQVIRVDGAVAGSATPATTTAQPAAADPGATTAKRKSSAADRKAKAKTAASDAATTKTSSAVSGLDTTSGADYVKKSAKLPKEVGTPGKAPEKDNKAPAGGGSFDTIG